MKACKKHRAVWQAMAVIGIFLGAGFSKAWANQETAWSLAEQGPLSFQQEIVHTFWEVPRPPMQGGHDRIGLHRLVDPSRIPKAAVVLFPGTNSNAGNITCDKFIENTLASIERHKNDPDLKDHALALEEELPSAKERLIARYLAANGYDVFAMDYRTHFVPMETPPGDLGFMKDWGWEVFLTDAKAAIDQAKAISGQPKVFLGGTSFGGMLAMNYAARYWKEDLRGLILLDGGNGGKWRLRIPMEAWKLVQSELLANLPELPEESFVDGQITPAILQALIDVMGKTLIYKGMFALDLSAPEGSQGRLMKALSEILGALGIPLSVNTAPHFASVRPAAFKDILAKPVDPVTGDFLKPFDPKTGRPFPTYLDWNAELTASMPLPGLFSNLHEGYNSGLGLALNQISGDRYWPLEIYLEALGMFEFELTNSDEPIALLGVQLDPSAIPETVRLALSVLNTPEQATKEVAGNSLGFGGTSWLGERLAESLASLKASPRYDRLYKEIDVPLLTFQSRLGLLAWGPFNPGVLNKDVTDGGEYPFLGHLDIYTGTGNVEWVNRPMLDWLNAHSAVPGGLP